MNLPNKLTLLRVILVPFFIACYLLKLYYVALIIFVVASFTDMLDGKIARKHNLVTNFGKIMDPLADKVLVYSAFCLMIPEYVPGWMLIIILAREFTISGMRTVAASEGTVVAAGMSGKIKTVLQMIAVPLILLYAAFLGTTGMSETVLSVTKILYLVFLYGALVMTVYSGTEYVIKNKTVFRQ